jgi:hypothetical protein
VHLVGFQPGALSRSTDELPGEIDYRLLRQSTLADYRTGKLARHEVCDAHPELRRAAREIGTPVDQPCPVCDEGDLVHVRYVFGPRLPPGGRCITSEREMARISQRRGAFACYLVEVCPLCAWNHLARVTPLGQPSDA